MPRPFVSDRTAPGEWVPDAHRSLAAQPAAYHTHHYPDGQVKVHGSPAPAMSPDDHSRQPRMSRRRAIGAVGLATAAAATTTLIGAGPAGADQSSPTQPSPRPIPGGIDAPPVGLIHWWLPGPADGVTPLLAIPGFGFDADPSTITDFYGYTAFAVLAGEAKGSDGATYPMEVDVRVMDGVYVDDDGKVREGAYAFI